MSPCLLPCFMPVGLLVLLTQADCAHVAVQVTANGLKNDHASIHIEKATSKLIRSHRKSRHLDSDTVKAEPETIELAGSELDSVAEGSTSTPSTPQASPAVPVCRRESVAEPKTDSPVPEGSCHSECATTVDGYSYGEDWCFTSADRAIDTNEWCWCMAETFSSQEATEAVAADDVTDANEVTVTGTCNGNDGLYSSQGVTATGARYYYSTDTATYLFYDPSCDKGSAPARWLFGQLEPSTTATSDLDDDGICKYYGDIKSNDLKVPLGTQTWDLHCSGAWTDTPVTIDEAVAANDVTDANDVTHANEDEVTVTGTCNGNDGLYSSQGVTATGARYYYSTDTATYLFYDPSCDKGSAPARWVFGQLEPSTTATSDLDDDGICKYYGDIKSNDLKVPLGTQTWDLHCSGAWTDTPVTIDETTTTTIATQTTTTLTTTTTTTTTITTTTIAQGVEEGDDETTPHLEAVDHDDDDADDDDDDDHHHHDDDGMTSDPEVMFVCRIAAVREHTVSGVTEGTCDSICHMTVNGHSYSEDWCYTSADRSSGTTEWCWCMEAEQTTETTTTEQTTQTTETTTTTTTTMTHQDITLPGDFSTVVTDKVKFLRECSAALAPAKCVSVRSGSIVLTVSGANQAVVDAAESVVATKGLTLPSFGTLYEAPTEYGRGTVKSVQSKKLVAEVKALSKHIEDLEGKIDSRLGNVDKRLKSLKPHVQQDDDNEAKARATTAADDVNKATTGGTTSVDDVNETTTNGTTSVDDVNETATNATTAAEAGTQKSMKIPFQAAFVLVVVCFLILVVMMLPSRKPTGTDASPAPQDEFAAPEEDFLAEEEFGEEGMEPDMSNTEFGDGGIEEEEEERI